jgi:protease-4
MEFNENNQTPSQNPSGQQAPMAEEPLQMVQPIDQPRVVPPPKKKSSFWRVIVGILLGLSVIGNIVMFIVLVGMAVLFAAGQEEGYRENVLQSGPRDKKIVVVTLDGIIDDKVSEKVVKQVDRIRGDRSVKAMILQINSPGGGVAASDRIYVAVSSLTKMDEIPAVACMQDVAASGGYYSAVGCDRIVAEPTTITGSIGVIMSSFVVQDLLENKLGIQPIVIKAGGKKDWPSPFKAVTDEQRAYLEERLIQPAYKRFVDVVKEGRPNLTARQVDELADGSIYTGQLAEQVGLVDRIGYMKDAIDEAMKLAKLNKAMVVRYKEPFSLAEMLTGAEGMANFKFDRSTLCDLSTPQLMYLWGF